jgi:hypothetical protein
MSTPNYLYWLVVTMAFVAAAVGFLRHRAADGASPPMPASTDSNPRFTFARIFQHRLFQLFSWERKLHWAGILLIATIAITVRIWDFGHLPNGINQDEAMAAVDAKALADYGTDRFGMYRPVMFTAWGYGQMSVLLSYSMVPFIKLFGLNTITARLPALFASLAGLAALYLFIRDHWGKSPAFAVSAFAAINPWHILQSRWSLDCNMLPHMFMIGIFLLSRHRRSHYYLFGSMIFFALCMYCYGVSFVTLPVFLSASAVYLLWTRSISWLKLLFAFGIYALIAWPVWAVMVINTLKLQTIQTPWFTIPYFPHSTRSNDIIFFTADKLSQLKTNFDAMVSVVVRQGPDAPWNALPEFGSIYLCSIPFAWVGLFSIVRTLFSKQSLEKTQAAAIAGLALSTGLWAGLVIASVNMNRINLVFYPMIILSGIGIWQVIRWLPPLRFPIAALYAVLFVMFCGTYFGEENRRNTDNMFYRGFGEALKYVKDIPADTVYVTSNSQYPGSRHVSEILTIFFHDIDSLYLQGQTTTLNGIACATYAKRYRYVSMYSLNPNPFEKAVYIVNNYELAQFNQEWCEIYPFSDFSAVVPRHLAKPAR